MIDFIKLLITYISEKVLLSIPGIEWSQEKNLKTGEMNYPIRGKYKTLDITINPKRKEISGSLHKFWNELNGKGNQNFDDFNFSDLQKTIEHLQEVFNLEPEKTRIENLEYGVNINIDYCPKTILTRNLIVWSCKTPSKNLSLSDKGEHLAFITTKYYFKIYDKGKQAQLNEYLIRIEVGTKRNEYIRPFGINSLQDLSELKNLHNLLHDLKETFSSCLIVDDLSGNQILNPKEKNDFKDGINPFTWKSFDNDPANRKRKERFTKRFNEILDTYQLTTIKNHITKGLQEKGENLLICHKWNDFETITERSIQNHHQNPETGKMSQSEPYIYFPFVTNDKCIITGVNISKQTTNKTNLQERTIKEISQTDPETFNKLIKQYKTDKWANYSFEKVCEEIAHRVRRNKQTLKEKIKRYENSFFPLDFTQGGPDTWKIN